MSKLDIQYLNCPSNWHSCARFIFTKNHKSGFYVQNDGVLCLSQIWCHSERAGRMKNLL